MKSPIKYFTKVVLVAGVVGSLMYVSSRHNDLEASSHREAPLIANDPVADNTDLYAFRSPDNPDFVTIIASYNPLELPHGGPIYYTFGTDVAYEIHIKNNPETVGDDITYRFRFKKENEDPTTFFRIRLGLENQKTTYTCLKSVGGGEFQPVVVNGVVPPPNIGPRSIEDPVLGLGKTYEQLYSQAVTPAMGNGGEIMYCGPIDDPFFADLGGIFDLAHIRAGGEGINAPQDALACTNVHAIALKIPISTLQKDGKSVAQATNILDSDFVIGVWASSSRSKLRALEMDGDTVIVDPMGPLVQVSRLGMPLTNEVIIPIGDKDEWNSRTPFNEDPDFEAYFTNPELGLYMDEDLFGDVVPGLSQLRIQEMSPTIFGPIDFTNGADGLFPLFGDPATQGTALDPALFGTILLQPGEPRSVDLLPIFFTGVPNLPPYQLATGKPVGNPLAPGKPFVNNFLPTLGDMLRLNMAVPVTQRDDPNFSSLGLLQAAVLGLTDPAYNTTTDLQFIPNMDGFPNGRRLEDDVTRIELQTVSGIVLAAIGFFYDDYEPGTGESPVTQDLLDVLAFTTGIEMNDTTFRTSFPYAQVPWSGYGKCSGPAGVYTSGMKAGGLQIGSPALVAVQNFPNPFSDVTSFKYHISGDSRVTIRVVDLTGKFVATVEDQSKKAGNYTVSWNPDSSVPSGIYIATVSYNGIVQATMKMNYMK